jgi:hypothetical protein
MMLWPQGVGYQKCRVEVSQVLMTFNCQRRDHNRTCQGASTLISEYTNLIKLLEEGRKKRSIVRDSVKYELHIKSEVKLETFVYSALFRFTKGLVLRNTIQ